MIETKSKLRGSWYDYNWDWALISLFALVLLAGIVLWTHGDHPGPAAVPADATTGHSTGPSLPIFPN